MRIIRFLAKLLAAFTIAVTAGSLASVVTALFMGDRFPNDAHPEDDEIEVATILGTGSFRSEASAFRGGRVICWHAGADVDLRGARLDPDGAELEVWTVFGGLAIRVPETWPVQMRGIAVFGGAGSAATKPAEGETGPGLAIRYRVLFGGLGVAAEPDDEVLAV